MITIICLIYRSTKYAKAVYENLHKYTPMLSTGEAELLFVANDATPEVLKFLKDNNYPHIINNNKVYTDEELLERGYHPPEYIGRVYRGYNEGVKAAKGEIVVLINSDNLFAPNWLENLYKWIDKEPQVVCSRLVERNHPKHGMYCMAHYGEFGSHPDNFKEEEFLDLAQKIMDEHKDEYVWGGAFMPSMFYKEWIEKAGYYPEGNLSPPDINMVSGDKKLFEILWHTYKIRQITACDSISYHFKEGEKDE